MAAKSALRIALAQINPTVGDIAGNTRKIEQWIALAKKKRADLVVFPELTIPGYPPKDLLAMDYFIEQNAQALRHLATKCQSIAAIVGFVDRNPRKTGKPLMNAAAVLENGKISAVRYKTLLPSYDVFDETRHFESARDNKPLTLLGHKIGLTICEDAWNDKAFWPKRLYSIDPVERLYKEGARLFINISSSPFHCAKTKLRLDMIRSHVKKIRSPFFFVNQVGGNDELIFDGHSFALDQQGNVIAQGGSFREDMVLVSYPAKRLEKWKEESNISQVHDALVLGLRDYAAKCGFKKVLLGLSGGIDSAVTAALAVRALGKENVLGVSMPSMYSSEGSISDSEKLASSLGIELISLPISSMFKSYMAALSAPFKGAPSNVAEENLQARIRGTLLMALSNKFGSLLLTTGNKSELSMGYCTLYGDMNGGLAVIADVPKMMVYELGRYLNKGKAVIPEATFTKAPSAELRPNQTDQDSLPPYPVLDAIIEAYVEEAQDVSSITAKGFDRALVERILRAIDLSEYKREQAAPGLRITPKAFGSGRRMPIARGDFRKNIIR